MENPPRELNRMAASMEGEAPESVNVQLIFNIPVGVSSRYAHHMLVQVTENEVVMSFFEIIPPVLTGSPEEQKLELGKGVRADCVSRVTIARPRFPEFVRAMVSQLSPEEKKGVCQ